MWLYAPPSLSLSLFFSLQLPATTNLFDSFGVSMNMVNPNGPTAAGGAGAGPLVIPQMSASCPTNVKEERDLTMMHACKLIVLSNV